VLIYNIKNTILISKRDESEVAGFKSNLMERAETRRNQVKGETAEVTIVSANCRWDRAEDVRDCHQENPIS